MFSKNFSDFLTVENVLSFNVEDGNIVRKDFSGTIKGCIRPLLSWKTEKTDL
jgi:hypothetical protein